MFLYIVLSFEIFKVKEIFFGETVAVPPFDGPALRKKKIVKKNTGVHTKYRIEKNWNSGRKTVSIIELSVKSTTTITTFGNRTVFCRIVNSGDWFRAVAILPILNAVYRFVTVLKNMFRKSPKHDNPVLRRHIKSEKYSFHRNRFSQNTKVYASL